MEEQAAIGALKRAMAGHLEKQLKELDEMRAYFRQDLTTGEFDWDTYQANSRKKEEESKQAQTT